jgi:hypothetical protein
MAAPFPSKSGYLARQIRATRTIRDSVLDLPQHGFNRGKAFRSPDQTDGRFIACLDIRLFEPTSCPVSVVEGLTGDF